MPGIALDQLVLSRLRAVILCFAFGRSRGHHSGQRQHSGHSGRFVLCLRAVKQHAFLLKNCNKQVIY
jgi:hypothetical protein